MNGVLEVFSINSVFFMLWGYEMSYIEFFGTIFNIWCVYLAARAKVLSWPVGIVGTVFYIFLFYQIQLYSDLFEQLYFLFASFYGWWLWSRVGGVKNKNIQISYNSLRVDLIWGVLIVLGTISMGFLMSNINAYLPAYFPEPADYPYLDAFTTVMSFVAMILMAQKKIECWYLWIFVDIIGIWLYYAKGVKFISLEYMIFLVVATKGCIDWVKEYKIKK